MTKRTPLPRRSRPRPGAASDHLRVNRALWERGSDSYDRRCARVLGGRQAKAWGLWRIPEARLRLLGPVRGKDVLEVGCGAARWSHALAAAGARVVGLDLSNAQLRKARRERRRAGRVALIRANAERLPFVDDAFDVAFSDWGALTFSDPRKTVPEVARVLRPGGRLVFATSSPFRAVVQPRVGRGMPRRLRYDYFGLHRLDYPREVNFALGYADWVELFRRAGLSIGRLVEFRPSHSNRSAYLSPAEEEWGRHWPLELIWTVTKSTRSDTKRDGAGRRARGGPPLSNRVAATGRRLRS